MSAFRGSLFVDGEERIVDVTIREGVLRGSVDGVPIPPVPVRREAGAILIEVGGRTVRVACAIDGGTAHFHLGGRARTASRPAPAAARGRGGAHARSGADEPFVASPMTGTVAAVEVVVGARVARDAVLVVVEAMKMQFVVRAPRDVVVTSVRVHAGEPVDIGEVLVEFAEVPEDAASPGTGGGAPAAP